MRQFRRVVPIVLLLAVIPSSASAQGLLRWLGRLSGPGPFWGTGAELRLKCLGIDEKPEKTMKMMMGGVLVRVPCDTTLDDRHTTIYFNLAGAVAENNPLFYGDEGRQEESTAVRLVKAGVSADWTFHKAFDIGAGFGMIYFAGPRFDNFSRGFVQPVRLSVRPIMLGSRNDDNGWLIVAASWQILLGTIDGADFGAPLDSFRSSNEHVPEIGVTVDLVRFVRRFKIGLRRP